MSRLEPKHSLPTRVFHWLNGPILLVMIYSGLLIYWANDVYSIRVGRWTLFHFFPDWFYRALHLPSRLAEGMAWHFDFMWFFALNGLAYVLYTFTSGVVAAPDPETATPRATRGRSSCTTSGSGRNRSRAGSSTGRSGWPIPGWWRWGRGR